MTRRINVIVTSTRRKRRQILSELCLREISDVDIETRAKQWIAKLESFSGHRVEAQDLYAGDHWQIARSLPQVAKSADWDVRLWICSPGYGLVKPKSLLAPYSATFSMTHADSVSKPSRTERVLLAQRWWNRIAEWEGPDRSGSRTIQQVATIDRHSPIVVVASKSLIKILEPDILRTCEQLSPKRDLLIVSGGTRPKGNLARHFLPCDARLQSLLGGARMSLNVRVLRHLLSVPQSTDALRTAWENVMAQMLSGSPKLQRFDRVALSDDEVRRYILEGLNHDRDVSRTRLLRRLRDSGFRCEEKRFRSLFECLVAELG